MKLYATVTSERASKGQGGNKYIRIDLTMLDGVKFCTLYYGESGGEYSLGIDRGNGDAETILTRGNGTDEFRKGEKCEHCGKTQSRQNTAYCEHCGKLIIARI